MLDPEFVAPQVVKKISGNAYRRNLAQNRRECFNFSDGQRPALLYCFMISVLSTEVTHPAPEPD
jgi:hypothetical protein